MYTNRFTEERHLFVGAENWMQKAQTTRVVMSDIEENDLKGSTDHLG